MLFERSLVPVVTFLFLLMNNCDGQCNWPTVFQSSTWLDSSKDTLVFTATGMSGYSVPAYGSSVSSWECLDDEYFAAENILLIKSTTTIPAFNGHFYVYLCFEFTKLTDISYRYYHIKGQAENAGQHRAYLSPNAVTDKSVICDTANRATGSAFSVMIKQGSEADAITTCPTPLLGRFTFDYTDSSDVDSCNTGTAEHMNVCTDKTKLAFDTPCTGKSIVYADAEVNCVDSLVIGSTTFVQLYNPQATVDNSNTYRFACMAISSDSLTATVVYNNCTDHMTPTYRARSHDTTTIIGAKIVFSVFGNV